MEEKTNKKGELNGSKTIKEIVLRVIEQENVNQIYVQEGEKDQGFTYRFIIILENMAKRFKDRLKAFQKELIESYPKMHIQFKTLHNIITETSVGNTFYLNTCTNENLAYSYNDTDTTWLFKNVNLSAVITNAKNNFKVEKETVLSFKTGAEIFIKQENYKRATFMLHQVIELSFVAIEKIMIGFNYRGHLISDHQAFMGNIQKELGLLFPRNTKDDILLLSKLNTAYEKSRYTQNYKIEKEHVLQIEKKADYLIKKLDYYFNRELEQCKVVIAKCYSKENKDTEDKPPAKTEKPSIKPSLLDKIKTLSKENLHELTLIEGKRKGYCLNNVRIYDYYIEMFGTWYAKSYP